MSAGTCVVCGALGTTRWTIDNGDVVVVADLCGDHGAPLNEIVEAAGTRPPAERGTDNLPAPRRQPKKRDMTPLDWTPPKS